MALIHNQQVYVSGLPARNLMLPPAGEADFSHLFGFRTVSSPEVSIEGARRPKVRLVGLVVSSSEI
jgi:hypothetical protein